MGRLVIAHHKSYHPYRRDNIERVRRDEEEAELKEAQAEGKMALADAEARIALLRDRAGISDKKKKSRRDDDDKLASSVPNSVNAELGAPLPRTNGHINFFEDLEQSSMVAAIKSSSASKKAGPSTSTAEDDKGIALAPSERDLNPWYSSREMPPPTDKEEQRRRRDSNRKSAHDPLTSITKQLSSHPSPSSSSASKRRSLPSSIQHADPVIGERLSRESSERLRALELIRRKKREMQGSETPSTVHGGYDDMFNRDEVEAARKSRRRSEGGSRTRDRYWDDDRKERARRDESRGRHSRGW
ncbi:uncharacterized protein SCHCODRAFT_02645027 [Schizophyllum commune H4-8]|uniref:CBF1-interacting co-repressor CIR N-terminal domain-containing protein n=1 Tax=Schizophyllum commune (strain H4-8 / FGSC 9210) TaxID=578458 RepID=D8QKE1_SCHCM|nr:uncharacterized protein SCHCODRAFT_02645027 [Schizophyllum commune H4-8]KAI5885076.1 hypothetical protein SCHCODRAFT_02645027 [Schizophyllum commune H4-8]